MKKLPFKRRPLEITIHTIIWFLVFCFPFMLTEWGSKMDWEKYLRHSIVPFCSFLTFYINYLYLIPCYLFKKKNFWFLLQNAVLIVGMVLLIRFGHSFFFNPPAMMERPDMPPPPLMPGRWMFMGRDSVMMTFIVCLSTAVRISIRWQKTEERLIEIEQQKTDAELKNLKNQLNPHFLLNTLNNIYALITFNKEKAQESVLELSKLLRHVLYDNQQSLVPLEKELDFISNYISLMRIRLPESVRISVRLSTDSRQLEIAPLIFISLIENAFKHGISPEEESFIGIAVSGHDDGNITCEIINSNFPKNRTDKSGSGIGLEQVQLRLELSYPNRYEWHHGVSENGKTYTSLLTIQSIES